MIVNNQKYIKKLNVNYKRVGNDTKVYEGDRYLLTLENMKADETIVHVALVESYNVSVTPRGWSTTYIQIENVGSSSYELILNWNENITKNDKGVEFVNDRYSAHIIMRAKTIEELRKMYRGRFINKGVSK